MLALVAAVLWLLPAGASTGHAVALTFDDLPVHGDLPPGMSRSGVIQGILDALRAHAVPPVYGFVNGKGVKSGSDEADALRRWVAAGHLLGSHTFSHVDLHAVAADAFAQDVDANEATLRAYLPGGDWHWLRFPFLHEGETPEKRQAVAALLKRRGYRVAQVSLNHNDWAFSDPYARCLARGDTAAAGRIEAHYLKRAGESLAADLERTVRVFGHDIAHVMLLHVSAFQSRVLPRLLSLLESRGFTFVTLAEAQADRAYAIQPARSFAGGATWLDQVEAVKGLATAAPEDDTMARLAAICR